MGSFALAAASQMAPAAVTTAEQAARYWRVSASQRVAAVIGYPAVALPLPGLVAGPDLVLSRALRVFLGSGEQRNSERT